MKLLSLAESLSQLRQRQKNPNLSPEARLLCDSVIAFLEKFSGSLESGVELVSSEELDVLRNIAHENYRTATDGTVHSSSSRNDIPREASRSCA